MSSPSLVKNSPGTPASVMSPIWSTCNQVVRFLPLQRSQNLALFAEDRSDGLGIFLGTPTAVAQNRLLFLHFIKVADAKAKRFANATQLGNRDRSRIMQRGPHRRLDTVNRLVTWHVQIVR
jgi:hypothetical protein